MKEQVSLFAKSAAFNIFSFFFSFGYTGERLITDLGRKILILRVCFLALWFFSLTKYARSRGEKYIRAAR